MKNKDEKQEKDQQRNEPQNSERSSRVETRSPLPPADSQRTTTTGETSANRGSNQTREELSRDGRAEADPRIDDEKRR